MDAPRSPSVVEPPAPSSMATEVASVVEYGRALRGDERHAAAAGFSTAQLASVGRRLLVRPTRVLRPPGRRPHNLGAALAGPSAADASPESRLPMSVFCYCCRATIGAVDRRKSHRLQ